MMQHTMLVFIFDNAMTILMKNGLAIEQLSLIYNNLIFVYRNMVYFYIYIDLVDNF